MITFTYFLLSVLNLGFFINGILKARSGDHSFGNCFAIAGNFVAGIYFLVRALTLELS